MVRRKKTKRSLRERKRRVIRTGDRVESEFTRDGVGGAIVVRESE